LIFRLTARSSVHKVRKENEVTYVDGFVIAIPKKNVASYKRMAKMGCKAWMENGALHYFECLGDDLKAQFGMQGFPKMTKLKPSETVIFAFIIYKSKAHRDKVNAAVMKEFSKKKMPKSMPFKIDRVAMGGFKTMVSS
jgi:uncharacterized protein YbaA (DUF1428 family)